MFQNQYNCRHVDKLLNKKISKLQDFIYNWNIIKQIEEILIPVFVILKQNKNKIKNKLYKIVQKLKKNI